MSVLPQLRIDELHHYSLDQYHRLIESGGFDEDEPVELLDGLLFTMSPKTPAHESAVRWLSRWLMRSIDDTRYEVGVGSPLTLQASEPEPDLAVFEHSAPRPYHPATAALVMEVAVSSLTRDLGAKALLYAAADIPEYWVLDIDSGRLVVHREPLEDGYGERRAHAAGDRVVASALALPALDLDELLRAVAAR